MYQEYRQIAMLEQDLRMKPGETVSFSFQADPSDVNGRWHRLCFRGEAATFYMRKSEPMCTGQYLTIEDSLNMEKAQIDGYCLDLSSKETVIYPKCAYYRKDWPPLLGYIALKDYYTENWSWGITASVKNLTIEKDGYLRFRMEVFYKEESGTEHGYVMIPDEEYIFDIQEGTYDLKKYMGQLTLSLDKVDHVGFFVEGCGYCGEVYLEQPFLIPDSIDRNFLPAFEPMMATHDMLYWHGMNLSKKEWPTFQIAINGQEVCNQAFFERCHRYTQYECNLPKDSIKAGDNTISFTLDKDYPVPFRFKEVGFYPEEDAPIVLHACPETASVNGFAKLLIEVKNPDTVVTLTCASDAISAEPQTFATAGYHVFSIACHKPALQVAFTLHSAYGDIDGKLERIVVKEEDGVMLGSGDMVYINHESMDDVHQFLAWYVGNHAGNLLTIRNIYRWSGARRLVPEVWEELARLLNELDMHYAVMKDGRNLAGAYCNPTKEMIDGKGFLGRQVHERDGHVYSTGTGVFQNLAPLQKAERELWAHVGKEHLELAETIENYKTFYRDGDRIYLNKNGNLTDDAKVAAEHFIQCMQNIKLDAVRHTGITSVFKYMYQAGFDWLGAELMYTGQEVTGTCLRGAAKGYHKDGFGAHLAVQWGSSPHDDILHVRRYRLALYDTYLQGFTQINTEEGFWWMEEYYSSHNRASWSCKEHLKQQQDLHRYVDLNTRKGEFYTPTSYLHGRYDGWQNFGANGAWGQAAFTHDTPEKGWQFLKLFYPKNSVSMMIYRYNAPAEPQGYFTGTPRGMVDVVPAESGPEILTDYKNLVFVGYHKAEQDDMDNLLAFLKEGGNVLMGWPHLSETTKRPDVMAGNHTFLNHPLKTMLAEDCGFVPATVEGKAVHINPNIKMDLSTVVKTTDDGQPLLIKKQIGKGVLWFLNAREYPADEAVCDIYAKAIQTLSDDSNEKEDAFISCGEDVKFAIYRRKDGTKDIYLLAMDWYNLSEESRKATLRIGKDTYPVEVPFGTVVKIVVKENKAAWMVTEEAVVLDVDDTGVTLSGSGNHTLFVAKDGKVEEKTIVFTKESYLKV